MGIKKLTLKKTGAMLVIIATIITITTNLKFVWNSLKFLGSLIVKLISPLTNPIGRDVLLFILILGLLIWLILISIRIKKFKIDDEEKLIKPTKFYGGETKEDESEEWGTEHIYVLELIANSVEGVDDKSLFSQLERKFPQASKLDFGVILDDLSEDSLIIVSGYLPDAKVYVATREGRKLAKKIADVK